MAEYVVSIEGAPRGTYTKVRGVLGDPDSWDYAKPEFTFTGSSETLETVLAFAGVTLVAGELESESEPEPEPELIVEVEEVPVAISASLPSPEPAPPPTPEPEPEPEPTPEPKEPAKPNWIGWRLWAGGTLVTRGSLAPQEDATGVYDRFRDLEGVTHAEVSDGETVVKHPA